MKGAIAVSGMGRIGRLFLRKALSSASSASSVPTGESSYPHIRAINVLYPVETLAHLLKYDTIHGKWDADITISDGSMTINGHAITIVSERDPGKLPWHELGIDIAIDATGKFNDRNGAGKHLAAGAASVILTAPAKRADATIVMGVNDYSYDPRRHKIISSASCTTNCAAPVLKILDDAFRVKSGWITTVHAYTNDQNHLDNPHADLRRARACSQSIIPTSTGIGKALSDVIPHLAPVIQGISLRVPTQDVSLIDLTVKLGRKVSPAEVKAAFLKAIHDSSAPHTEYCEQPLVSTDFIGHEKSAIIDGLSTMIFGDEIKILAWYDNEWSYVCRVLDLANLVVREGVRKEWSSHMIV